MTEESKTIWTTTTEGFIPAILAHGIEMPVKTYPVRNDRTVPTPMRTSDGHLIYATPVVAHLQTETSFEQVDTTASYDRRGAKICWMWTISVPSSHRTQGACHTDWQTEVLQTY